MVHGEQDAQPDHGCMANHIIYMLKIVIINYLKYIRLYKLVFKFGPEIKAVDKEECQHLKNFVGPTHTWKLRLSWHLGPKTSALSH